MFFCYFSNTFAHMKYLILWAVVITADFMVDFRFEFLYSVGLLIMKLIENFKEQSLVSDVIFSHICLFSCHFKMLFNCLTGIHNITWMRFPHSRCSYIHSWANYLVVLYCKHICLDVFYMALW